MSGILKPELEDYIAEHSSEEYTYLSELNALTHTTFNLPQMLSGQVQGNFLRMISTMLQPNRILEVGTYTGYATICLAQGLNKGGLLYSIDINEEIKETAETFFEKAGLENSVKLLIGNALELISDIEETFDLVFIDADKKNYCAYYDLIFDKVRPGGIILADNVLWSGKVIDMDKKDRNTKAIRAYNKKIQEDNRVENVIVSIRDGIMMAIKK